MDLTVTDVARMLQVSQKTVYRWLSRGKIPAYRINDQYRFDRSELLQWVVAQKLNAPEELMDEIAPTAAPEHPSLAAAIERGGVLYRLSGHTRSAVLHEVAHLLKLPPQVDRQQIFQMLEARERLGSTAIGHGIALPHSRQVLNIGVDASSVTLCFLEQPLAWGALDGEPVHALFTLVSHSLKDHVGLLSRIMFALRDDAFRGALEHQAPRDELYEHIKRIEQMKLRAEQVAAAVER